jgi:PAS domain S-box-containing protein
MKLSTKILLAFLVITILATGSAVYLEYFYLHSIATEATGKQQLQITQQLMEEIDIFLYERLQNIKTIGQAPPIIQALANPDVELLTKASKKLNEFYSSTGPWNNLVVLNMKGEVVISTYDVGEVSKRSGIQAAFQSAIGGKIYYSDAVLSLVTGKPTVFFAYPMRNSEAVGNPIVGVVIGELAWPALTEYLEKIQEPQLAHLFNSQGLIIGSNNPEHEEEILKTSFKISDIKTISEIPSIHGGFNSLTTRVDEQGHLSYKGNGWTLILETQVSVALASARTGAIHISLLVCGLILFCFGFLYLIIQRIYVRRAAEISSALKEVSTGNLNIKLKVKANDELGQLSEAFNLMAARLKESYETLDQKVLDRTKDLEEARSATQNVLEDLETEKERLAQAKAKDEALLDSIGEGVIATDENGKIILVNQAAEQMLGWTAEELMGKLFVEACRAVDENGDLVPKTSRPIVVVLSGETTTTTISHYYSRKNGTIFPVAITVAPVRIEEKIVGAIDIFRDITKEKEIEKLRTDFLSLASHQLRTPLSGTKWLIGTLRGNVLGKVTRKQKQYLNQIYQLNERMIQLVSEMLSILRLESETKAIETQTVLISNLYKDISISMDAAAKSRKVFFENNLDKHKAVKIKTNQEILKSILECFISNAINYSKPKQKIVLDMKEEATAVVFSVKDNGIGIPEEDQKQIFKKFYRASNAKDFKPGGSGLGLNIARTLAEKIGAEISFESKIKTGTIFYLHVPNKNYKIE